MSTENRPCSYEVIDDLTAAALRRMGGAARLAMVDVLCRAGRELMGSKVRAQHPDWTTRQVQQEVARRVGLGTS
jgi:hypothetical protein